MHRIDTPTAQVDKFGAGKNGFTAGNPQTGTPATDLDEAFFDTLQEELAAVVENAGIALDKAQKNQLLTALQTSFQSRDATLTAIAALTGAANKLAYFNGADAAALTDLTSVGRDVIGQSSIANLLTYLGLGNISLAGVSSGQLSTNGYINIPAIIGGVKITLIIQWGEISIDYSITHSSYPVVGGNVSKYTGTLTFPLTFPSNCFNVIAVSNDTSNPYTASMFATNLSSAAWSLMSGQSYASTRTGSSSISWISIGY